jgi:hypothetical protein
MKQIILADNLHLPLDVAGQTLAIFGIRGSGKTNTAGVLVEELLKQAYPVAIIDPTDAWWGLRAGRNGDQAGGFQVFIFGGPHGDIPLQETDGKIVAEFLVNEQVPIILSLRHLRKGAQRRFVTEFCEELYHLKGNDAHRTPLTVVIDEAPSFVPQKVMGEVARTVGAVEDLIARGRNSGFGVVLISQRSATLNADVRTQADTIICHRVTSPLDRKAISDWFEDNASTEHLKSILQSLATLKNGEAWTWAPTLGVMSRVQMRLRQTFDSSATPKMGETVRAPKKLTEINIDKLKGQLASAIEKSKADDPKELRKQISLLNKTVESLNSQSGLLNKPAPTETVEVSIITADDRKLLDSLVGLVTLFKSDLSSMQGVLEETRGLFERVSKVQPAPKPANHQLSNPSYKITDKRQSPAQVRDTQGSSELGNSGLRRILIALAQYPQGRSSRQVGILAGLSSKSGSFNTYLSKGRTMGWITGDRGELRITAQGLSALGDFEPLPQGQDLLNYWLSDLGDSGAARILRVLAQHYPRALSKAEVGNAADLSHSSGSFNTYLSKLRTLELIEGRGELKASDTLFE